VPRALIVEDDAGDRAALAETLASLGFETNLARSVAEGRNALESDSYDLALLDVRLPDGEGFELLSVLQQQDGTDVVFVTGCASVESAVEALRAGADDYLTKPIDPQHLERIALGVLRTTELRGEVRELRDELRRVGRFCGMVGRSESMQAVYTLVEQVAPTDSTVMVLGSTGTGKELVATAVHAMSRRAKQPFVPLNCGAVSPTLIESELFGHEKGSFTGADRLHRGVFERAHGGTLFLDEITEMPIELQVKLLRVIETGRLFRVGADRPIDVDVRLVAASNRDPHEAVKQGTLREDLLYRLLVFPIQLPPLRERGDDVELLAGYFLAEQNQLAGTDKRISPSAIDLLRRAPWPGNVRELKHLIERAFILSSEQITPETLPLSLATTPSGAQSNGSKSGLDIELGMSIAEAEKRLILATLDSVDANKKLAAEILGVSVKTLYNRLREYGGS